MDSEDIQRINVIEIDGKSCTHEVAWPEGQEGSTLPPPASSKPPAREYKFKLDPFQQTAVNILEAGHSVLVAAHTSAGKTVVAEYAFAMVLRDKQRVIYTSPLKALSNQKYRELQQEFGDVGLMTGDVTINPNASCLVMTTEILRSMLYRGSEIVREVQLLVYDEIHYLRDKERGVVWEESIILAPRTARFAFLSATIPNAREFAEWIAKIHESPCHVVYTDYRPTPLEHYVFPAGGDGLYLVVDSKGTFREDNFTKAVAVVNDATGDSAQSAKKHKNEPSNATLSVGGATEKSDIVKLIKMIMERNFDPIIVFSFSKKECEALAMQMVSMDLNSSDEKKIIESVFNSAIDVLSVEDQKLPQIRNLLPMLQRGFGVHHSGLLPILKEMVEILFQEGLIKALFATETFSTGLNMPAKTVCFTHVRKFDGGGFRWVSGGEYIQMSGRAGRRGLDDKGLVIMMLDAKMEPAAAKQMLKGAADTLYSEFHLQYNMLLNLLKVEGVEPEELMRRSYRQFQTQRMLPTLQRQLQELEARRDEVKVTHEEAIDDFLNYSKQLRGFQQQMRDLLYQPKYALPFLQPGRLLRIKTSKPAEEVELFPHDEKPAWASLVNFQKAPGSKKRTEAGSKAANKEYVIDVLVNCETPLSQDGNERPHPRSALEPGTAYVIPISLSEVQDISSLRIYVPKDLRTSESRQNGVKTLAEVAKRFEGTPPLLNPVDDMKVKEEEYQKLQRRIENVEHLLSRNYVSNAPNRQELLGPYLKKKAIGDDIKQVKKKIKGAQELVLLTELKQRIRVLKRLDFVSPENVVTLKGRVASEISTGDELVVTELVFSGFFKELNIFQLCAILSCFVWRERSESGAKVPQGMEGAFSTLRDTARRICKVANDCQLTLDADEYVSSFSPTIMDLVAAWAQGARFLDILKSSGILEGSIVRAIRRLEELLRQLGAALRTVGDLKLAEKCDKAIEAIKRDIIFAASLYL